MLFIMYIGDRNSLLDRDVVIKIAAIGAKNIIDDSVFFILHLVYWFLLLVFHYIKDAQRHHSIISYFSTLQPKQLFFDALFPILSFRQ